MSGELSKLCKHYGRVDTGSDRLLVSSTVGNTVYYFKLSSLQNVHENDRQPAAINHLPATLFLDQHRRTVVKSDRP